MDIIDFLIANLIPTLFSFIKKIFPKVENVFLVANISRDAKEEFVIAIHLIVCK